MPEDFEEIVRNSQGKEDAVIEVVMIGPNNEINSNLRTWSFDSVSN